MDAEVSLTVKRVLLLYLNHSDIQTWEYKHLSTLFKRSFSCERIKPAGQKSTILGQINQSVNSMLMT